jgi:2-polyprenyl-3-methyl-5-hydroxy-6-metoxy-1,4-benzoquinol methylase
LSSSSSVHLSFPECLAEDFASELPLAEHAVAQLLARVAGTDLSLLATHNPALAANAFTTYLRCSLARMVHVSAALKRRGIERGRVLDYASWFGNMSLLLASQHYSVEAIDGYREYGQALQGAQELLTNAGIGVYDFAHTGRDLHGFEAETYDVVVCMGVIEHVPHTPRLLLEALNRVLKPGGFLVLDTPNHAYIYNRQRLAKGESVMADLPAQYYSAMPFEGHHREYTPAELVWMLRQIGHDAISVELFNYSLYGLPVLASIDLANYWASALDPSAREVILTVSRRADRPAGTGLEDWRDAFVETEPSWVKNVPDEVRRQLQEITPEALGRRKLQQYYTEEISRRDREISALNEERGTLIRERERRPIARLRRAWRRLIP